MSQLPKIAIGWSANADAFTAGESAARTAAQQLGIRQVPCTMVFASSWLDQAAVLGGVRSVIKGPLIGGSTAGEITPDGPKSHSCVVLAIAQDGLASSIGAGTEVGRDPRLAGYHAAQDALKQFRGAKRTAFLLFGDGMQTGYAEVLRGIQEVLGTSFLVTGGLMGDDLKFSATYQYLHEKPITRGITGALLGGCAVGVGLEHGFAPISKPRKITKAHGNLLNELDGLPASRVYEEYFGEALMQRLRQSGLTREMIAYPLGVQLESTGQFLLRTIMSIGADGSLVCTGEVKQDTWVQLMIGSKESCLDAAAQAARQAVQSLQQVWFVLMFSSVVRKRLLGQDAGREIAGVRQVVGPNVPLAGCYTYGEQAPLGTSNAYGRSSLHTGSCLIVAVGAEAR